MLRRLVVWLYVRSIQCISKCLVGNKMLGGGMEDAEAPCEMI